MTRATAYLFLGLIAAGLPAGIAAANCVPPYKTIFACNIYNSEKRVEFCQETPNEEGGVPERYSYNFADGGNMSDLYFETDDNYFAYKYINPDREPGDDTAGVGLRHGPYIYAFYITGIFGSPIRAAQIHVYDTLDSFSVAKTDNEILRLYCEESSVLVDWTYIGP